MKTLLTVSLAIFNVVFGVKIGSVSKEKEAAQFFFVDSNNPVVCTTDVQEAATFHVLDSNNSSNCSTDAQEAATFFLSNSSFSFLEGLYESYNENE